jgi:hypothetical protein
VKMGKVSNVVLDKLIAEVESVPREGSLRHA